MSEHEVQAGRRQVARERGAAVLADLKTRAGVSENAELARRSELAGVKVSDETISNLLKAKGRARERTVRNFITACLYDQAANPRLVGQKADVEFWKARYDEALGRAGDPLAGLVRIGQPPPAPAVFVGRPDVVVLGAVPEAGKSVVLIPTETSGVSADKPGPHVNIRTGQRRVDGSLRPAEGRSQVLAGMGGVGKSQLAAQYAREVWRDPSLDLLVWVSARSADAVVTAYAQAAAELLGVDRSNPEQGAQQLMSWLSTTSQTWLIVLDDVQLPNQVQRWWPRPTESGQVIMTTRYRGDSLYLPGQHVAEVGTYSIEQARGYLERRLAALPHLYQDSEGHVAPGDALDGLADDLGRLPLALTHAAAYLLQEDIPVHEYRELLADYRTRLSMVFPHHDELPDADLNTVATTWQISLDLAARLVPGGVPEMIMRLVSLLDPDGIPREVFDTEAVANYLRDALKRVVSKREVWSAVQVLHRLSLLTIDRDTPQRSVQVHALVQRTTRERHGHTPDAPDTAAAHAAADAVLEIWPEVEADAVLAAALRSNSQVLFALAETALWTPEGHGVIFRAGSSLGEAGLVADAVTYYQNLHRSAHNHLGPDHHHTLLIRSSIAGWLGKAGNPGGAVTAYVQLLNDLFQAPDPNRMYIFAVYNNLAYCQLEAGDPVGAATILTELVSEYEKYLGPEHPHTLNARGNLARCYGEAGDPARAAAAYAELLDAYEKLPDADPGRTLKTRVNLARWRGEAGDPAGAATACAELLDDMRRTLGPDHPDTLATRGNLARWRGEAGDPAAAVETAAALLLDYDRRLGPDHPDTLITRGQLAHWRGEAGDPAGAATAYAGLLEDLVRVLGPDHPDTLDAYASLVIWRGLAGDDVAGSEPGSMEDGDGTRPVSRRGGEAGDRDAGHWRE